MVSTCWFYDNFSDSVAPKYFPVLVILSAELLGQLHEMSHQNLWERSGSVVECLTRDRRVAGSSLIGVTALVSLSKNINPSLELV